MEFKILKKEDFSVEIYTEMAKLFSFLTESKPISFEELKNAEHFPQILLVFSENRLIAMATLTIVELFSGKKAWVEDVVVLPEFQNQGIGKKMMEFLLHFAEEKKVKQILLYSNPKRVAAHQLYKKIGFLEKESTLFSLFLDSNKLDN